MNGELILRFQQLQSRLATLKIENEEVKTCMQIMINKETEGFITSIQKPSEATIVTDIWKNQVLLHIFYRPNELP